MLRFFQMGTSLLAGRLDRIITSSFYHFPKKRERRAEFVGEFFPNQLKSLTNFNGAMVTVYLKQPNYFQALMPILVAQKEITFQVFSQWKSEKLNNLPEHIILNPIHRESFLISLAQSKALLTTAGNQVIGEAIYLRKPVLTFPEPEVLEQELNALG